jgi:hypothetical protein
MNEIGVAKSKFWIHTRALHAIGLASIFGGSEEKTISEATVYCFGKCHDGRLLHRWEVKEIAQRPTFIDQRKTLYEDIERVIRITDAILQHFHGPNAVFKRWQSVDERRKLLIG